MIHAVQSLNDLMTALGARGPRTIELAASIVAPHSIMLPRGFSLRGKSGTQSVLSFSEGGGLGLAGNNVVSDLMILTAPHARAIFLTAGAKDYGTIELKNLNVTGQVGLIIRTGTLKAHIVADKIHVAACDARAFSEQPQKFGVNVLQGAFTLYHFNGDPKSKTMAKLTNISAGAPNAPVFGSGIFVSGCGDAGGFVEIETLTTGPVYSHGLLTYGTADIITAAVFLVYGAKAKKIENLAEVVTYGVNDMVLDNWGSVDEWIAHKPIISWGPSGIGFVNFGTVTKFTARDTVVTHGLGARGFNQYEGTVKTIRFKSITTWGDGAIGVQVSKPIGSLTIDGDLTTHGGTGNTLVRGANVVLAAHGLSVKTGGSVNTVKIGGSITTHGTGVSAYALEGGSVKAISVGGTISALGKGASAISLSDGGSTPLSGLKLKSSGKEIVNNGGAITDAARAKS